MADGTPVGLFRHIANSTNHAYLSIHPLDVEKNASISQGFGNCAACFDFGQGHPRRQNYDQPGWQQDDILLLQLWEGAHLGCQPHLLLVLLGREHQGSSLKSRWGRCLEKQQNITTKNDVISFTPPSRFPCCVLLALSWNTNVNPSTDELSRAINYLFTGLNSAVVPQKWYISGIVE